MAYIGLGVVSREDLVCVCVCVVELWAVCVVLEESSSTVVHVLQWLIHFST